MKLQQILLLFWGAAALSQASTPTLLTPGTVLHRKLSPKQEDVYSFTLREHEFAEILVQQHGIDTTLSVLAPGGRKIEDLDDPVGLFGTDSLLFIADADGSYLLTVRGDNSPQSGEYDLRLLTNATPGEKESLRIKAQQGLIDGRQILGTSQAQPLDKSRDLLESALAQCQQTVDRRCELIARLQLAVVFRRLNQNLESALNSQEAIHLARESGNPSSEAVALDDLGQSLHSTEDVEAALRYYQQSLKIWRDLNDPVYVPRELNHIGAAYSWLGYSEDALDCYRQALNLSRKVGNRSLIVVDLVSIAQVWINRGELRKALPPLQEAEAIYLKGSDLGNQAILLAYLGRTYHLLNEDDRAVPLFRQAMVSAQRSGRPYQKSFVESLLADVLRGKHEFHESRTLLEDALAIDTAGRVGSNQIAHLTNLAKLDRDEGNLAAALNRARQASALAESLRNRLDNPTSRAGRFAAWRSPYGLEIELLQRLHATDPHAGHDWTALEASERVHARSLLDMLVQSRIDVREGADPQLLETERLLLKQIAAASAEERRLLGQKPAEASELAAREQKMDALLAQYEENLARIRHSSPHYATLTQPETLRGNAIQDLLDPDTALIEYLFTKDRTYAWVVTKTDLFFSELGAPKEIEQAVRQLYTGWSRAPLSSAAISDKTSQTLMTAKLSRMILAPLLPHLGAKRWLVVADGPLHYVPFGVLAGDDGAPAVAAHEIVNLPSASVLKILRDESKTRRQPTKLMAVLADPVFERDDPRLARLAKPSNVSVSASSRSFFTGIEPNRVVFRPTRLPFTHREAESIASLAPPKQVLLALDFQANREQALTGDLADYRFLHFATHGFFNNAHPAESGLVFSLFDESGAPRDGMLRLHDIYNLKTSADLVVMSACQSGLGKEINGEGLIGLTRGMMYAGAPRVVSSLWKVDDAATAELMKYFYRGILVEKMAPAAALRAAQLEIRKQKRWQSPYYWAAFTLQGEFR